ncbi:hypothetical protein B0H14DRAFT_231721 [Mycena olivaceomarginata]|nr:hypothetical protein B0H14DRAFT_231721 [Mycena olivaceomarginata]
MSKECRRSFARLADSCSPNLNPQSSRSTCIFSSRSSRFGLADTIPFHVQLTGFVSSLLGFVPELEDTEKSTIVGSLVRQIVFDLNGRHMTRSIVLGDAKMTPRPPGAAAVFDAYEASLDWDGEVRCNVDATVGTFDAGCVRVQDFIVLELKPLCAATCSEFVTLRHSHPIKLVTESWDDSSLARDDPR